MHRVVGERYKERFFLMALEKIDCRVGEDFRQIPLPKFFVIPVMHERPNNRAVPFWIGCAIFDVFGEQKIVVPMCRKTEKLVIAVVQRVFVSLVVVKAQAVIVLTETRCGIAVSLHDFGDVLFCFRMSAKKGRLRVPAHLVPPRIPSSTRRAAYGSCHIGL